MLKLPTRFQDVISTFSFAFRSEVWIKFELLLLGAIICPGSRTVCNVLRSIGLQTEKNFPKYHRFLNRDKWSSRKLSSALFRLLVHTFVACEEAIVLGLDDTIERRWGRKISKRGIYRDPVRSTKSHFVKCSGLRWLSVMLLSPLPWLEAGVYWALPFLTILCPSERFYTNQGKSHKKLTDWAVQIIAWIALQCRDLQRDVYLTGDGSFATLEIFIQAQRFNVGMIARMKLNARLYHLPPKEYPKGKRGPVPPVGKRILGMEKRLKDKRVKWTKVTFSHWYGQREKQMLMTSGVAIWRKNNKCLVRIKWVLLKDPEGQLEPVLLGCTAEQTDEKKIVEFFVRRWKVEVTFAEVRRHLGVETQRQWSDLAIERATPCLMALFSVICLFADKLHKRQKIIPNQTAWYRKKGNTFSDILVAVRMEIFNNQKLLISSPKKLINSLNQKIKTLCFILTQAAA